jgi:hypothetical protein
MQILKIHYGFSPLCGTNCWRSYPEFCRLSVLLYGLHAFELSLFLANKYNTEYKKRISSYAEAVMTIHNIILIENLKSWCPDY